MICYLPFTFITEAHIAAIFRELGVFTLYIPEEALVPDHVRAAAEAGRIELRSPLTLPSGQLIQAIQAYKQWADLHKDNLADLTGYFKTSKGQIPMMDETNPSQISSQIRKFGDPAVDQAENPVLRAALFLSMTQEYDQQQEIMRQGLGKVHEKERGMLARLSGEPERGDAIELDTAQLRPPEDLEPGGYMTAARVAAWGRMVLEDNDLPDVYLTSSPAVISHLLDLFPEAEMTAAWGLSAGDSGPAPVDQRRSALHAQARGEATPPDCLAGSESTAENQAGRLALYTLTGISPRVMLRRLNSSKFADESTDYPSDSEKRALIGIIALP